MYIHQYAHMLAWLPLQMSMLDVKFGLKKQFLAACLYFIILICYSVHPINMRAVPQSKQTMQNNIVN